MNICEVIEELIYYGTLNFNVQEEDYPYLRNRYYELFHVTQPFIAEFDQEKVRQAVEPTILLDELLPFVQAENKDRFYCQVMDVLLPKPSEVSRQFKALNPSDALKYLYDLSVKSYYVKKRAIDQNIIWNFEHLIVTINLSKPEILNPAKPQNVARYYPQCSLCKENVGFSGNESRDSRINLRTAPICLNQELWHLQYSPYLYFREHCIIFSDTHRPMQITNDTFRRLLDFVDLFPEYFIGSNAGLDRIGGSILSHDHYQGGRFVFPLQKAPVKKPYENKKFPEVTVGKVLWYNSVIRLVSENKEALVEAADTIYRAWQDYNNEALEIISFTDAPHNGITPIVHKENNVYVMNMILRNNRTSAKYPDGIFHAHPEYHHIKKEGIGLIEAMGEFILPGRLKAEITPENEEEQKNYIKDVCIKILENTAVFKDDEKGSSAFDAFIIKTVS